MCGKRATGGRRKGENAALLLALNYRSFVSPTRAVLRKVNNNRIKESFCLSFFLPLLLKSNRLTIRKLIARVVVVHHVHLIVFFAVGYHTTTTPSSTSSSNSSTNACGARTKNEYDNGSGRGNGGNDCNSNGGHQQQISSSWSSLVKSESSQGLRGTSSECTIQRETESLHRRFFLQILIHHFRANRSFLIMLIDSAEGPLVSSVCSMIFAVQDVDRCLFRCCQAQDKYNYGNSYSNCWRIPMRTRTS